MKISQKPRKIAAYAVSFSLLLSTLNPGAQSILPPKVSCEEVESCFIGYLAPPVCQEKQSSSLKTWERKLEKETETTEDAWKRMVEISPVDEAGIPTKDIPREKAPDFIKRQRDYKAALVSQKLAELQLTHAAQNLKTKEELFEFFNMTPVVWGALLHLLELKTTLDEAEGFSPSYYIPPLPKTARESPIPLFHYFTKCFSDPSSTPTFQLAEWERRLKIDRDRAEKGPAPEPVYIPLTGQYETPIHPNFNAIEEKIDSLLHNMNVKTSKIFDEILNNWFETFKKWLKSYQDEVSSLERKLNELLENLEEVTQHLQDLDSKPTAASTPSSDSAAVASVLTPLSPLTLSLKGAEYQDIFGVVPLPTGLLEVTFKPHSLEEARREIERVSLSRIQKVNNKLGEMRSVLDVASKMWEFIKSISEDVSRHGKMT